MFNHFRWRDFGSIDTNYKNCGGTRSTDGVEDYQILMMALEDPSLSIREISDAVGLSEATTRRRLAENGLRSQIAAKKTMLNSLRKPKRISYCSSMLNFQYWPLVIFVDESHFCSSKRGPRRVIRPRGERFNEIYINFIDFSGRITVSVFGLLTSRGLGPLIRISGRMNAQQYVEILQNCLPFMRQTFPDGVFFWLQDNCPVHKAQYTLEWFDRNISGQLIEHPPYSPDLNPIENIWGILKERMRFCAKPRSSDEFFDQIRHFWFQIGEDRTVIQNLYTSMRDRLRLCLQKNGSSTRY